MPDYEDGQGVEEEVGEHGEAQEGAHLCNHHVDDEEHDGRVEEVV